MIWGSGEPRSSREAGMGEKTTDFWDQLRFRDRRFTLVDLMTIVAVTAVVCAALAGVLGADIASGTKGPAFLITAACPVLCGLVWFLSGLNVVRFRWLDGALSLVVILLTVVVSLLVLTLAVLHPVTAGLTSVALFAMIAYLSTWVR
jgi:hypothetical protein